VLVVKQLNLNTLRWLVMMVVGFAAVSMLRSALRESKPALAAAPAADGFDVPRSGRGWLP